MYELWMVSATRDTMKIISDWFRRFFNDPQTVILSVVLALGISVVLLMVIVDMGSEDE